MGKKLEKKLKKSLVVINEGKKREIKCYERNAIAERL